MKSSADNKICPYCGEEIKIIAIKCRHCNEYLEKDVMDSSVNASHINLRTIDDESQYVYRDIDNEIHGIFTGLGIKNLLEEQEITLETKVSIAGKDDWFELNLVPEFANAGYLKFPKKQKSAFEMWSTMQYDELFDWIISIPKRYPFFTLFILVLLLYALIDYAYEDKGKVSKAITEKINASEKIDSNALLIDGNYYPDIKRIALVFNRLGLDGAKKEVEKCYGDKSLLTAQSSGSGSRDEKCVVMDLTSLSIATRIGNLDNKPIPDYFSVEKVSDRVENSDWDPNDEEVNKLLNLINHYLESNLSGK